MLVSVVVVDEDCVEVDGAVDGVEVEGVGVVVGFSVEVVVEGCGFVPVEGATEVDGLVEPVDGVAEVLLATF